MKLALGTAQFGLPYGISNQVGVVKPEIVKKIINHSNKLGIDTIDTAKNYGNSEELLGNIGVNKFKVVTKISINGVENINIDTWIKRNIEDSLNKLNLDIIYGVMIHNAEFYKNEKAREIFSELQKLKYLGKISKIGVSVYDPIELRNIINNFNIDIVQIPLNLIDRRFEREGLLKELANRRIEIHSRSTFLQGLLLMENSDLPPYFRKWSNIFKDFEKWTKQNTVSKIRACLNYPSSLNCISKIVIAVNSLDQFNDLISIYDEKNIDGFPSLSINETDLIDPRNWKVK